jgi:nitrite reductase/ring-hydroxylating ferredoxin subunit
MRKKRTILKLEKIDEDREIEFELDYLSSLTVERRFSMMLKKSEEIRNLFNNCGHRKTPKIIKRK